MISIPYDVNDPSPCEKCEALCEWSKRQWAKLGGYSCPVCGIPVPDPIAGEKNVCPKCGYGGEKK